MQAVRDATERFRDVSMATGEGYALQFGCVSGGDFGAMGMHFVNGSLVATATWTPRIRRSFYTSRCPTAACGSPARTIWCSRTTGTRSIPAGPPQLMGQLFHLFESSQSLRPSRVLHAACLGVEGQSQWHVRELESYVSCDAFNPDHQ